jgi:7-cyano-7-deazaguanine synthase
MKKNDKAVVLLSGGLDSATVLAIAKDMGYRLYTLSFSYGQRHVFELEAARKISRAMGAEKHLEINMNRSEERRVGKECRRLCRSRWSPYH